MVIFHSFPLKKIKSFSSSQTVRHRVGSAIFMSIISPRGVLGCPGRPRPTWPRVPWRSRRGLSSPRPRGVSSPVRSSLSWFVTGKTYGYLWFIVDISIYINLYQPISIYINLYQSLSGKTYGTYK